MKLRAFLALATLSVVPTLSSAQALIEPVDPPIPPVPAIARSPRAPIAPAAAFPPMPALSPMEAAQPPTPKPAPAAPAAPAVKSPPTPAAAPAAPGPPAAPRALGQMLNVEIEVTLSDSKGTPKVVMLTVADGEMGQNRTGSSLLLAPGNSYSTFHFNADARPNITGGKIRLYLSAEATVPALDPKGPAADISLRQSQTLILNDGDSVEIARASDPVSERSFALSVKVKIQR